ncbi:hypothetical protein CC79DRAFT_1344022 [Sarocladium strictum]
MAAKTKSTYTVVERIDEFDKIQVDRPDFEPRRKIETTKHPHPEWKFGQGVKRDAKTKHREINPYAPDRPAVNNYRLLVAGIAPRPIGFIGTLSGDGKTKNLAPFSYFQIIGHDLPMFIVGFSSRPGREKDTLRNLRESKQCVTNSVSEVMIKAVNKTSIDARYSSGLSVEARVVDMTESEAHGEGISGAGLVRMKATRFWVRKDATNADGSSIDLNVLRSVGQLGNITCANGIDL